jgi:hypothetical protein
MYDPYEISPCRPDYKSLDREKYNPLDSDQWPIWATWIGCLLLLLLFGNWEG